MKERIRQIIDREQLSPSSFADKIGVQRSSVSHILSGRNKPSLDFVLKVLSTFSDINTEWLLFGRGEMYINKNKPVLEVQDKQTEQKTAPNQKSESSDNQSDNTQQPESQPIAKHPQEVIVLYNDKTFVAYKQSK